MTHHNLFHLYYLHLALIYLIQLVESVVLLFVLAVCIDLVRARLFDALGRLLARTRPGARLDRLIGELDRLMKE